LVACKFSAQRSTSGELELTTSLVAVVRIRKIYAANKAAVVVTNKLSYGRDRTLGTESCTDV